MKKISYKKLRLQNLRERLQKGEDVAVRDLKNALTAEEFSDYGNRWEMQKEMKSWGRYGSSTYDKYFKKGLFHYNKAESGRFNKKDSKRFYDKAQDWFGKALEVLKEEVGQDPMIAAAYDRNLDFSDRGDLSLSPAGMPRRIDSKSLDNLSDVTGGERVKVTKRDLKIRIVNQSLADFDNRKENVEGKEGKESMVCTERKVSKEGKVETVRVLDAQGMKLAEMLRKLKLAQK